MTDPAPARAPLNTLRGLLPFLKPHRRLLAGWLFALAFSSAATLTLPVAVKHVVDQGFSDTGSIDPWFALLFGVTSLLGLATAARFYFVSLLGERVVADLRRQLYGHLLGLDQAFFERNRSGELVSRLSADTEMLRGVVGSAMSIALRSSITVVGSAVMLAVTSPRLAGFALLGIPLVVLPLVLSGRKVRGVARDSQDRVADANARAAETLGAMHTVQSYAREDHERGRFGTAVDLALRTARRRIRLQAALTGVVIVLVFGAVTAVLWIGARDVVSGAMGAGALLQFLLYATMGAGSVTALGEVWDEVQRGSGGMGRIADLLAERPGITAPTGAATLPAPVQGRIAIENVRFHYPTRPDAAALEDFSLAVAPGETVALVGPSGAGKSTVF